MNVGFSRQSSRESCTAARFPHSRDAFTDTSFILGDKRDSRKRISCISLSLAHRDLRFFFFSLATLCNNLVLYTVLEGDQTEKETGLVCSH